MIIGAGIFQVPGIVKAKELGHCVIAIDNNPKAPGFEFADHIELVSTTNAEKALAVARKYQIDGVMTLSTEVAVPIVSHVAQNLNLQGLSDQVAQNATNKVLMSGCFARSHVPSPKFVAVKRVADIEKALSHTGAPAILKLLQSSGSRGAYKILSRDNIEEAYQYSRSYSKVDDLILQEFLEGIEIGGEAFFFEKELKFCFVTNKTITGYPDYVPLGHSLPSRYDKKTLDQVSSLVADAAQSLGIENGPVNFDIMITADGLKVIEIGARIGGTCLPLIVYHHSGIDSIKAAISLALGESPLEYLKQIKNEPVAVKLLTSQKEGVLEEVSFPVLMMNQGNVVEYCVDCEEGDVIKPFTCGAHRFGHVIAKGSSWGEAENLAHRFIEQTEVRLK